MLGFLPVGEKTASIYVLDIEIEMCDEPIGMAAGKIASASSRLHHPYSENDSRRMDDAAFAEYQSLIDDVYDEIKSHGFIMGDDYQQYDSYSYYIPFDVVVYDGMLPNENVEARFRVSDHRESGADNWNPKRRAFFKSFVYKGRKYDTVAELLAAVKETCDRMERGDFGGAIKV